MPLLQELLASLPQRGRVHWIGIRETRDTPMRPLDVAQVEIGRGVIGDRFQGGAESKRQVTLIQAEHLRVLGDLLGRDVVDPALLRRNIAVSGINLLALQRARFGIGEAILEGTGGCHPCSRMERALGPGGFNAMRGHGGITARVVVAGAVRVGDPVFLIAAGGLAEHER
jgi:MOSC domain-containing protein YiiM